MQLRAKLRYGLALFPFYVYPAAIKVGEYFPSNPMQHGMGLLGKSSSFP